MRTIIETLAEHAADQKEVTELTSLVRIALARAITQHWFGDKLEIKAIGLDVSLERVLILALQSGGGLEPGLAGNIEQQAIEAINNQSLIGAPQVLIVNHSLRPLMSRFLRRSLPQLAVVSSLEISDERKIRLTSFIGQTVN
ncbi:Uncharacterized protein FWK35_00030837 [Aphis craccivora]|uniref:Uncharacterized protein n=1 Tax=Aphis craccivora TaxID=307492 RepID=A0A6G0VRL9_APHCR|nr:Uncharacterized protein FWK35_00030837 [Aphis craccivora]